MAGNAQRVGRDTNQPAHRRILPLRLRHQNG